MSDEGSFTSYNRTRFWGLTEMLELYKSLPYSAGFRKKLHNSPNIPSSRIIF